MYFPLFEVDAQNNKSAHNLYKSWTGSTDKIYVVTFQKIYLAILVQEYVFSGCVIQWYRPGNTASQRLSPHIL